MTQPRPWCSCWCQCVYHHTAQAKAEQGVGLHHKAHRGHSFITVRQHQLSFVQLSEKWTTKLLPPSSPPPALCPPLPPHPPTRPCTSSLVLHPPSLAPLLLQGKQQITGRSQGILQCCTTHAVEQQSARSSETVKFKGRRFKRTLKTLPCLQTIRIVQTVHRRHSERAVSLCVALF